MSDKAPVVSVCIANYNGVEVIDECLRSVLNQQGDIALEILVHDDASTDGSASYIHDRFPRVKVIEGAENVGFCVANNRMAAGASGEYLLLLNNDAALYPDALETLLAEARRLPIPSILGLPQYDAATGELIDVGCMLDPFLNPIPNRRTESADVGMVIGACFWIPKVLWRQLGGFPEWFGSIAEDMYLCARARLAGFPVRALGSSGYRHWQGKSFGGNRVTPLGLSTTFRRRALSERNKSFVMVVACPTPWMYLLLVVHLLMLLLEAGVLTALKGEPRIWREIYAPCFLGLWRRRLLLWATRKEVQMSRRAGLRVLASVFQFVPYKLLMLARHGLPRLR